VEPPIVKRTVAFVIGTGRSGTSLLDSIMGSHSQMLSIGEGSRVIFHLNRPNQDFPHFCSVCSGPCPFWNQTVPLPVVQRYFGWQPRLVSAVVRRASHLHRSFYDRLVEWSGKPIVVDASKDLPWVERQLTPAYHWRTMQPRFIFITRDGRAVVNSLLRRFPGRPVDELITKWTRKVRRINAFAATIPAEQKMPLAYECLASQPERAVQDLCAFLGVAYEPAMLRYWEGNVHPIQGNAATRSLIRQYRESQGAEAGNRFANARHGGYYDQVGLSIQLDLRWQHELAAEDLARFEALVGDLNRPFAEAADAAVAAATVA
jgi:hypothetical protein